MRKAKFWLPAAGLLALVMAAALWLPSLALQPMPEGGEAAESPSAVPAAPEATEAVIDELYRMEEAEAFCEKHRQAARYISGNAASGILYIEKKLNPQQWQQIEQLAMQTAPLLEPLGVTGEELLARLSSAAISCEWMECRIEGDDELAPADLTSVQLDTEQGMCCTLLMDEAHRLLGFTLNIFSAYETAYAYDEAVITKAAAKGEKAAKEEAVQHNWAERQSTLRELARLWGGQLGLEPVGDPVQQSVECTIAYYAAGNQIAAYQIYYYQDEGLLQLEIMPYI